MKTFKIYLFAFLIVMLCSQVNAQKQSESQLIEGKRKEFELSNYYMMMSIQNLLSRYTELVEWKIDSIKTNEANPQIKEELGLLKYNLVNVLSKTAFHSDPLVAGLDSWVLGYQLKDYFDQEKCKETYGSTGCLVLNNLFDNYSRVYETGLEGYLPEDLKEKARVFASRHPIENSQLNRQSVTPYLSEWIASDELRLKSGLLSMTDIGRDLSYRMEYYAEMLPKLTKWQLEYELGIYVPKDSIAAIMSDLKRLMSISASMLERSESLINYNRDTLLSNLDYQRTASLWALRDERIEAFQTLSAEREIMVDVLRSEREIMLDFIEKQRIAAMADVGQLSSHVVVDTEAVGKELIDYVFWRVVILIIVIGIFAMVGIYVFKKVS